MLGLWRNLRWILESPWQCATKEAEFAFYLGRAEHLRDRRRRFALTAEDLALFNPNTRTCQIFRTRSDAELTRY